MVDVLTIKSIDVKAFFHEKKFTTHPIFSFAIQQTIYYVHSWYPMLLNTHKNQQLKIKKKKGKIKKN